MKWFILGILLFLSAGFSATETAFTSLSLLQKKKLEGLKSRGAKRALKLCEKPDNLITTILVGNNIVNIGASALVTQMVIEFYGNQYVAIGSGVLTFVVLLFGEITPKQLALNFNVKIACITAIPVWLFGLVLTPVVWFFKSFSALVTHIIKKGDDNALSIDALFDVLDVAKQEGVVDSYEQDLVQRALHFDEVSVKSIMTHRKQVFSLDQNLKLSDAIGLISKSNFSRIPIYDETPENIIGVVIFKNLIKALLSNKGDKTLATFVHKPFFISENMKVDELFRLFKSNKLQLAIVLDEYGGLSGVVTMEDVSEQLLGELYDEHESGLSERIVPKPNTKAFIVKCETSFQEFLDEFDLTIEDNHFNTVAAYLLEKAGHILMEDEILDTEFGKFTITKVKGLKLETADFLPKID